VGRESGIGETNSSEAKRRSRKPDPIARLQARAVDSRVLRLSSLRAGDDAL
jgi:hypothetical protein